ncbi:MAG TPA: bifunctional alpha,alpha-trehalose-phosphate synthase (UDP-forming)/trehalose-phosphatase [Candidatus Saccharimonadales bacterium]|nr:bifunctional alpha,alpha-trehalose-phosphate synthase (UDP-forming)/trehalose-phosphatase [Candidatus Saccharimonadales bacterium]
MSKKGFLIISNRLPVSVSKVDGKLQFKPSSGGLATAMSSLDNGDPGKQLWIGWPGISTDDLTVAEQKQVAKRLLEYHCVPVFLSAEQIKNFYEGYANDTLWPLFHYFESYTQYNDDYWSAYKEVNLLFKQAVVAYAADNATVWVHDYHLLLLPRLLRKALPKSSIGFFLHIPFPSFEIFRLSPNRRELLEGVLGSDLVGFHTYSYARHFMSSALRTLGYEHSGGTIMVGDRAVVADAFPIGIDYDKFTRALHYKATEKAMRVLKEHYDDQRIILSVDRLDYTKGIPNRLRAFEEFLEQNPKYHKKVTLVIIAVPSRTEVQTYRDLRDSIEQTVSRINGMYATVDWTPISYQFKNIPFEQLVALYRRAEVALITPLRDGMNLVAKEYVACKQKTPGVLILSELAGAADELQEALRINPKDTASMVDALKTALEMPVAEQKERMQAMQRRISHYTVQRWASDFIEQLGLSKKLQRGRGDKMLTIKDREQMAKDFKAAKKRVIFLDYDGTLKDFVNSPDPAFAAPSVSLMGLLSRLSQHKNTELCIISGRTRDALETWFGSLPITLVAEHGSWVKQHGEWAQGLFSFQEYKEKILPIMERYAERTPGARIEEKNFALVWHYRNVPPELAYARNASLRHELNGVLGGSEVGMFNGNKIIEVKPRAIRKSNIVIEILDSDYPDFIFCAGDDYTDEDMFEAMPETAYTVKVGLRETHARFQVPSVEKLRDILKSLL